MEGEIYTLQKCPKCNANNFRVIEKAIYRAGVNADGVLETYNMEEYHIDKIYCNECSSRYTPEEFMEIDLGLW